MAKQLAAKTGREDRERPDLDKSMAEVQQTKDEEVLKRIPAEVPASWHRKLRKMRSDSIDNIPVKFFIMEAVEDLFEKYKRGEGKYPMLDD